MTDKRFIAAILAFFAVSNVLQSWWNFSAMDRMKESEKNIAALCDVVRANGEVLKAFMEEGDKENQKLRPFWWHIPVPVPAPK